MLSGGTTILEGNVILVLVKSIKRRSALCSIVLLTPKTTLKPFSGDALQKMHRAIGSRTSTAVDLQHDMVKAREKTDGDQYTLSVTRCHRAQSLAGYWYREPAMSRAKQPINVTVTVAVTEVSRRVSP